MNNEKSSKIDDNVIDVTLKLSDMDSPITMTWKEVVRFISFLLSESDIHVTDDVYMNLYGIGDSALRYHYVRNKIKKKQLMTTNFNEVSRIIPQKYKQ